MPNKKESRISQIEGTAALAHHVYLYTASIDINLESNEPVLHITGYNIGKSVKEATKKGM